MSLRNGHHRRVVVVHEGGLTRLWLVKREVCVELAESECQLGGRNRAVSLWPRGGLRGLAGSDGCSPESRRLRVSA